MATTFTNPVSDMMSGIGDDFFTDSAAQEVTGEPAAEAASDTEPSADSVTGADETATPDETTSTEGEAESEAEAEGEVQAGAADNQTTEQEAAQTTEQTEELPSGVRKMKDRSGNEGYFVEPKSWEGFQSSHKLVQDASNLLLEPLSMETLELRDRAYQGQERMYTDFLSGEPEAVERFIQDWALTAKDAMATGQIGGDPFVPFTAQLYKNLETISPDAYTSLRMQTARDLIEDMYQVAAELKNPDLYKSVGHIAKNLNLPFKPTAEMDQFFSQRAAPAPPDQALREENQRLKEQLNGTAQSQAQAAFQNFTTETAKTVHSTVISDVIGSSLASIKEAWAKVDGGEKAFNDMVVDRAWNTIKKSMSEDTRFHEQIARLDRQAKLATNPATRKQIGQQIVQAHVNKAKLVLEASRKEISTFAAEKFKEQNKQAHDRRAAAQTQRGAKGATSPVQKSLVPGTTSNSKAGTMFNPSLAAKEAAELFAQM